MKMKFKKIVSVLAAAAVVSSCIPSAYADDPSLISPDTLLGEYTDSLSLSEAVPTEDEADTEISEVLYDYSRATAADFDYYISENGEVKITNYKGTYIDLIIPDTIEGYPVTSIGSAFNNNKTLRSVIVPNGVVSLEGYSDVYGAWGTFSGCTSLSKVTLPVSLQKIGVKAFYGCSSLSTITIPEKVTYIGNSAFYNCTSLANVTIPQNVITIGESAFSSCKSFTSVTIPDNVITVGKGAFSSCNNITKATLSNSMTKVPDSIFSYCTALRSVSLPSNTVSIDKLAFNECENLSSISLPNSLTSIGMRAFSNCKSLRSISIPANVITIDENAFNGCTALTGITIPGSVSAVGQSAFSDCTSLRTAVIQQGVLNINENAFYNCTKLKSVTIPESVMNIYSRAFYNCTSLSNVTLPLGITNIYSYAFYNCSSITNVSIPSSVMSIGSYAFNKCGNLSTVNIAEGVEDIGSGAFSNCPKLTEVKMPGGIKLIPSEMFNNDTSLRNVVISDTAESIGNNAFRSCTALTSITVPDSVESIGDYCFYDCTNLVKIIIPESVKAIGNKAFTNCNKLTICGYKDSYAEDYCLANNIKFVDINQEVYGKPHITSVRPSDGQVAINWSTVEGAANYAVYYYTNGKWILAGTRTTNGMYVRNLTNGTKYGFAVKAYINGSWTAITSSDIVYATPVGTVKPVIIKAEGQNGQVALNWTAVSGATNYAVYYTVGGKWYNAGTRTATGMYVRNLTNGTKYGFAVKAYVNGTWSSVSSSDIVYATPVSAAAKPVITKAQSQNGRVALNWTAVNGATNYAVYTYLNGTWSLAGYRTATGMYVRNLTNGTKYGFAVKAYVNGAWTNITSADIVYATPTAAKSDLMDTDFDDFSFLEENGIDFVDVAPTVR